MAANSGLDSGDGGAIGVVRPCVSSLCRRWVAAASSSTTTSSAASMCRSSSDGSCSFRHCCRRCGCPRCSLQELRIDGEEVPRTNAETRLILQTLQQNPSLRSGVGGITFRCDSGDDDDDFSADEESPPQILLRLFLRRFVLEGPPRRGGMANLRHLDLSSSGLGDRYAGWLGEAFRRGCVSRASLRHLALKNNHIGPAGIRAVISDGILSSCHPGSSESGGEGPEAKPARLESLQLDGNRRLGNDGGGAESSSNSSVASCEVLADLIRGCPNLRLLSLGSCDIDDAGGAVVARALEGFDAQGRPPPQLSALYLSDNRLGDTTCRAIADSVLRCNDNLKSLAMMRNPEISEYGMEYLTNALSDGGTNTSLQTCAIVAVTSSSNRRGGSIYHHQHLIDEHCAANRRLKRIVNKVTAAMVTSDAASSAPEEEASPSGKYAAVAAASSSHILPPGLWPNALELISSSKQQPDFLYRVIQSKLPSSMLPYFVHSVGSAEPSAKL